MLQKIFTFSKRSGLVFLILTLLFFGVTKIEDNKNQELFLDFENKIANIQLPFIENQGQVDGVIKYYANIIAGQLMVTDNELTYLFPKDDEQALVLKESFYQGDQQIQLNPNGTEQAETVVSVFSGNDPEKWQSNLLSFNDVALGELYNNIEVKLKAYNKNIEKLFTVYPEGNPDDIKVKLAGANSLSENQNGELVAHTDLGDIKFTKPIAYQDQNKVAVNYKLNHDNTYGFELGNYDLNKPVVIDPLLASTFIGGDGDHSNQNDLFYDMEFDDSGNIIAVGRSYNGAADWPTTSGVYDETQNGQWDAVISKFNSTLTTLSASTFVGGGSHDYFYDVVLDGSNNVYVAGQTSGGCATCYPTTGGAYDETLNGESDFVVSILNADLTSLTASTYIGGDDWERGVFIDLDSGGNVIIAGHLLSDDYPTAGTPYDATFNSGWDSVVSKFNSSLTSLVASTYIGGSSTDYVYDMFVDGSNNVVIAGMTQSSSYPTTAGAYDETYNSNNEVFISVLDSNLTNLSASTFLGGWGADGNASGYKQDVAIYQDTSNNIWVTGGTESNDFPTSGGAYDTSHAGSGTTDVFVSKLTSDLTTLSASTYFGGIWDEVPQDIYVDASTNVYVTGYTEGSDTPTTAGAYDISFNGEEDVFLAKFNSTVSSLTLSTYIGGSNRERAYAINVDGSGNIYLAGYAESGYPTTSGAYNETHNGGDDDAFISKFDGTAGASHDYFAVTGSASQTAGDSQVITITAKDSGDNTYTSYTGAHDITFSGPSSAPDGTIATCAGTNFGTPVSLSFTDGVATCTAYLYSAESASIDVTDGTYNSNGAESYDLDVTVNADIADNLNFNEQPTNTVAGETISASPTVQVRDEYDNVRTSDSSTEVAIAIGNNPGSGTLSGTTPQTASSGVATFNDLSINKSANGYTLSTTSGGLTGDTSSSFNITPAAINYLKVIGTTPQNAGNSQLLTIIAYDAYDNLATGYTGEKSLTFSGPAAAPDGTVATCASTDFGSATNLTFSLGATSCTAYLYKAETTTIDVSDGTYDSTGATDRDLDVTINPGNADNLYFSEQPSNTIAGNVISPSPIVQVRDAYENIRTNDSSTEVVVAFNDNPESATLNGTTTQTASSGVATFNDLSINTATSGYSFSSSSGALTGDTSDSFNITPNSVSFLKVTGATTQTAGTANSLTITAYDAYDNIDTSYTGDKTITFSGPSAAANGTAPAGSSTVSFSSGVGTVDYTLYKAESTTIDVSDSTNDSTGSADYDLDVTVSPAAGSATYTTVSYDPESPEAGEEVTITITVYDAYQNPKTTGGDTVSVSITGTNEETLTVTDNEDGTYTTTYTPTNSGEDSISITINSEDITSDDLDITIEEVDDGTGDDEFTDTDGDGIPDSTEAIDPEDTDAVDGICDSIKGAKRGNVKITYTDDVSVTVQVFQSNSKKKTKVKQIKKTGYIAVLHPTGKRLKILNALNGEYHSSKKVSKKKWTKATSLKILKLRKKTKVVTIIKNKQNKLNLAIFNLKKSYKLGKKASKTFKLKKAIPKKTKKKKNKILIRNKKNKVLKKFLYTKKKKFKLI